HMKIDLTLPGQSQHEVLLVGNPETAEGAEKVTPIMRQGEPTVYLLPTAEAEKLKTSAINFRNRDVENVITDRIRTIAITGPPPQTPPANTPTTPRTPPLTPPPPGADPTPPPPPAPPPPGPTPATAPATGPATAAAPGPGTKPAFADPPAAPLIGPDPGKVVT